MNRMIKWMLASAVLAGSVAQAQTYDVNVDLGLAGINAFTFSGSFGFGNSTLSNVDVNDPFDVGAFTAASLTSLGGGKEEVTLFDNTGLGLLSTLSFDVSAPLGGSATSLKVSDVVFNVGGLFDYDCGRGFLVSCNGTVTKTVTSAPEIDLGYATEGFLLLAGGLLVLRGRRSLGTAAIG